MGYTSVYGSNDIIGIALDLDSGDITFYKNNISQGIACSGFSGTLYPFAMHNLSSQVTANFGASSFVYTPPSGFLPYGQTQQYLTTQPYYVTTGDESNFDFTSNLVNKINSVTITYTQPANTSIKCLISFDNRTTWKYWNGSAWVTAAGGLNDLQASGMTIAATESALANYTPQTGDTGLDFAFDLATTDANVSPSTDLITINYDSNSHYELTTVGRYGTRADYGLKRLSPTQTVFKKQSSGSAKVFFNVIT